MGVDYNAITMYGFHPDDLKKLPEEVLKYLDTEGEEGEIDEQFKQLVDYHSDGFLRLWTDPYGDTREEGYGLGYEIHNLDWDYGTQEFKPVELPHGVKLAVDSFGKFYNLPEAKIYQFIYVH